MYIRASVSEPPPPQASGQETAGGLEFTEELNGAPATEGPRNEELIRNCVEQVLAILERQKDR